MGILSLLENSVTSIEEKRLGLYSYGSGSEGEYFSAVVSSQYQKMLQRGLHKSILTKRQELTFQEYLSFYEFKLPQDGSALSVPASYNTGKFKLTRIAEHKRFYTAI
jgi:hydroxymethylglutaryl-CoA synthase